MKKKLMILCMLFLFPLVVNAATSDNNRQYNNCVNSCKKMKSSSAASACTSACMSKYNVQNNNVKAQPTEDLSALHSCCNSCTSAGASSEAACKQNCESKYGNTCAAAAAQNASGGGASGGGGGSGSISGSGNNGTSSSKKDPKGTQSYNVEIEDDNSPVDTGTDMCDSLFGTQTALGRYIHDAYNIMKFLVPILLLALSIRDYAKAILGQNDDEIKKATKKFITRLIIAIVVLVLPTILNFILKALEINTCFL